jgi:hypothetical protein
VKRYAVIIILLLVAVPTPAGEELSFPEEYERASVRTGLATVAEFGGALPGGCLMPASVLVASWESPVCRRSGHRFHTSGNYGLS